VKTGLRLFIFSVRPDCSPLSSTRWIQHIRASSGRQIWPATSEQEQSELHATSEGRLSGRNFNWVANPVAMPYEQPNESD
jgi:hypothetical protein